MTSISALLLLLQLAAMSCNGTSATPANATDSVPAETETTEKVAETVATSIPAGAQALIDAFPGIVTGYDNNKVVFADGTSIIYDDGKDKDFATMLDNSDIEDMFFTAYTVPDGKPEYLADAGRSRSDRLFGKIYGDSQAEVSANLVNVPWFGKTIKFNKVNGAADALKAVADDLAKHPEFKKYLTCSGTYYWRNVRGANRRSAHCYGIAMDIGVDNSDYWLWKHPKAKETDKISYANRIPMEIVKIFEKHGFIWGGAWYHFDTMHFEYRPEILRYAELSK